MIKAYEKWFEQHEGRSLKELAELLSFPSVSTDSKYQAPLRACCKWLSTYMKEMGLQVEQWEGEGHPILLGKALAEEASAPTLLFYGHYDVQPPDPLGEWISPPFEPEVREGKIYARGAIDNKGQLFYTLLAVKAFLELSKRPPFHIKLLIEGEEEIGSGHLQAVAEERREALQADHLFVVDLGMHSEGIPAVTLGARGIATLNVTLQNANIDLHSGMFGGAVVNPAHLLTTLLGKLWDEEGRVTLPRFYEGVHSFSDKELAVFDWTRDLEEELAPFDVRAIRGEGEYSPLKSISIRPTLEINGIESGYNGEGFKTIIPSRATAKLSCRLVANQDPESVLDTLCRFIKDSLPPHIALTIERGGATPALLVSPTSVAATLAAQAYESTYHTPCRRQLCGGSIPIVPTLAKLCGGDLVLMGVALPGDRMHAPNESLSLARFKQGFLSITHLLSHFSPC